MQSQKIAGYFFGGAYRTLLFSNSYKNQILQSNLFQISYYGCEI
jgi:hypothetical protein